jgi:hypothetical protein
MLDAQFELASTNNTQNIVWLMKALPPKKAFNFSLVLPAGTR